MKENTYQIVIAILDFLEISTKLVAGALIMYILFGFTLAMDAWSKLDGLLR